jgi:hypothetical protein
VEVRRGSARFAPCHEGLFPLLSQSAVSRRQQKALRTYRRWSTGLVPSGLTPSSVLECRLIDHRDEVMTYVPRGMTPRRSCPPFKAAWTAGMAFRNFSRPMPFAGSTSGMSGRFRFSLRIPPCRACWRRRAPSPFGRGIGECRGRSEGRLPRLPVRVLRAARCLGLAVLPLPWS